MRGDVVSLCRPVSVVGNTIATQYVKTAVFEALCDGCAQYALDNGGRDATPFAVKHPWWSVLLVGIWKAFLGRLFTGG
jgi:hypothetical protein